MRWFRLLLPVCLLSLLTTCDDDGAPWPAYRQELAELLTDCEGRAGRLVRDTGDTLRLLPPAGQLTPDTTLRAQVLYTVSADGTARLRGLSPVVSPFPEPFPLSQQRTDPVGVEALSRGGWYVNFYLYVLTSGGAHRFAFIDNGLAVRADGSQLLRLQLYHDRGADGDAYRRQVCLSCPLYGYAGRLVRGRDSVEVAVNTYDGPAMRRLPF